MDRESFNLKLTSDEKLIDLSSEYKLLEIEGLESSDFEINITSNSQYDGGVLDNKRIASRSIALSAEYAGSNSIESERERLIKFFNPIRSGKLIVSYGEFSDNYAREIDYEVESFKISQSNVYDPLSFVVTLVCPDPYFKDVNENKSNIAVWIGGLKFKFKLPTSFKKKSTKSDGGYELPINISGHAETPLEIEFEGPAENPCITNVTTGEFIEINKTLNENEVLYINTEYGNKVVKIISDEGEENAFNYINLDSTFFKLIPGENIIRYSNSNDELTEQNVTIKYKNKYLGI